IQLEGASTYENVTVLLKNNKDQYTATTDQKGEYLINRVIPGTYSLLASKDGFVTGQISEFVIEPSIDKQIELVTLSVAIRSLIGNVSLENTNDYAGVLVTATNIADETLVYSAITNSKGDYTLAGMVAGEYRIVISYNGYRTETLPTINIVSSTVKTVDPVKMNINKGTISGTVKLEGKSSNDGVKVELMKGSVVYAELETDSFGNYSFYVPQGNYSGVRFSKTDFASSSISKNIALFADNFVSMGDITLLATHNTISGIVDVLTTDDEGNVLISFDGVESISSFTTASDGAFSFEHVPVGKYVMRFIRNNCSDITIIVDVKASDEINLGTVTITPNTAAIKGKVILQDSLSSDGVTVSVDMGEGKTLYTTSDVSGRYELGGISVAEEYTVTYSKNGWKSDNKKLSPRLSVLEVRELQDIILVDNIAPTISNVVINEGSTFTDNPKLKLKLFALDNGTGIESYSIQIKKIVDGVESSIFPVNYLWQSFEQNIEYDLAQLPNTVYTGNGTYSVIITVKDKSGNMSLPMSKEVVITNNATSLTGQLRGENLHLTKNRSPYIVEANCTVGPEDTLVIDPGCEIRFAGDYSLFVAGNIKAVGTKEERIVFTKNDAFDGSWKTIAVLGPDAKINNFVEYESGSIIKNCDFDSAEIPLTLSSRVFVDNCVFQKSGNIKITSDSVIINSMLDNGLYVDNSGHGTAVIVNNTIRESIYYGYISIVKLEYNTIENVLVIIQTSYYRDNWSFNSNKLVNSTMKFEHYLNTEKCSINFNSFADCEGVFINYNLSSHNYDVVDYSKNYWGAPITE
ncbi:MAG: carboxypeptidase-like regulatory domain-containing protein, partial [Spirochaetales bacterium]|nr:carboxypeptidase-like regulatory domain-containing protein [Spirochaetales bacterium]